MNIIAHYNKRTLIFLKEEGALFVATLVQLSQSVYGVTEKTIVGIKTITIAQRNELLSQKEALEAQDIFIIDASYEGTLADEVLLIDGIKAKYAAPIGKSIPSPYFLNLFSQELVLATQKTRGPNLK